MSIRTESERTRELCRQLAAVGAMTYPLIQDERTPGGWPDRYICHVRVRCFLEMKRRDTGIVSEAQRSVACRMRDREDQVWIAWFESDDVWPISLEHPRTGVIVAESSSAAEFILDLEALRRQRP